MKDIYMSHEKNKPLYDELIEDVRRCAYGDGNTCLLCKYKKYNKRGNPVCIVMLLREAFHMLEILRQGISVVAKLNSQKEKHGDGEWKESFSYGCWHYDCPFCDDGYATKVRDKTPPNYCQNCGAKMDGTPQEEGETK